MFSPLPTSPPSPPPTPHSPLPTPHSPLPTPHSLLRDFENDEGEVVFLLGLRGPIFDCLQYAALDPSGGQSGVFHQDLDQAVFAELFAEGASRLDQSVGEGYERRSEERRVGKECKS